jgi:hypothetical protein
MPPEIPGKVTRRPDAKNAMVRKTKKRNVWSFLQRGKAQAARHMLVETIAKM